MKKMVLITVFVVLMQAANNTLANWTEVGDAGDLPGTSQMVTGTGPLNEISGTIAGNNDADMYEITTVRLS